MKHTPKERVEMARSIGLDFLFEENPVTGNLRLKYPAANDVLAAIELLGGVQKAADVLGVEEIEVETWADYHYVPTRYVAKIQERLPGWSQWSLQAPPWDTDAPARHLAAIPV